LASFLEHAALVAQTDDLEESAAITLLTIHNAKGLEWPMVFVAGMEQGLFPHQRSIGNDEAMEEERRLCYVAMTRARKSLYLTNARYRRRWGGGPAEATLPSAFLAEVPPHLLEWLSEAADAAQVELLAEEAEVRQAVRKNLYTGKAFNSVGNIAQFFAERGMPLPQGLQQAEPRPKVEPTGGNMSALASESRSPSGSNPVSSAAGPMLVKSSPKVVPSGAERNQNLFPNRPDNGNSLTKSMNTPPPSANRQTMPSSLRAPGPSTPQSRGASSKGGVKLAVGSTIQHPKFGRGTILRREGEGEDAKLTISFPGHGLKKIYEKFLGLNNH
jgi:DNA helicase II / ATP-dependent DNA helicase PcrA